MSDLFFYGTLRHVALLECVLGRAAADIDLTPAHLPEHAVSAVRDMPFPMIHAQPGAQGPGVLVRGLSAEDIARLNFYEGGFDYDLRDMTLTCADGAQARAQVYFPAPGLWTPAEPWSLERWAERWGALSVRAATEVMAHYGRLSPAEIAQRFPAIRRRAASWLAARARPADPDRDLARDVHTQAHDFAFLNFFGMEEARLQFRRHDGSLSDPVERCALMVGAASVVLPYDPVRDQVLLVEQFRAPVFLAGDPAPWVWEPVAGLVDPGETPAEAALREAREEAGLMLARLEPVGQMYSSTGSSGEFLHLFIGIADLTDTVTVSGAGVAAEGEDIRSRLFGFEDLMAGVDNDRWRDMPLVTCALWLARHRDRLRAAL